MRLRGVVGRRSVRRRLGSCTATHIPLSPTPSGEPRPDTCTVDFTRNPARRHTRGRRGKDTTGITDLQVDFELSKEDRHGTRTQGVQRDRQRRVNADLKAFRHRGRHGGDFDKLRGSDRDAAIAKSARRRRFLTGTEAAQRKSKSLIAQETEVFGSELTLRSKRPKQPWLKKKGQRKNVAPVGRPFVLGEVVARYKRSGDFVHLTTDSPSMREMYRNLLEAIEGAPDRASFPARILSRMEQALKLLMDGLEPNPGPTQPDCPLQGCVIDYVNSVKGRGKRAVARPTCPVCGLVLDRQPARRFGYYHHTTDMRPRTAKSPFMTREQILLLMSSSPLPAERSEQGTASSSAPLPQLEPEQEAAPSSSSSTSHTELIGRSPTPIPPPIPDIFVSHPFPDFKPIEVPPPRDPLVGPFPCWMPLVLPYTEVTSQHEGADGSGLKLIDFPALREICRHARMLCPPAARLEEGHPLAGFLEDSDTEGEERTYLAVQLVTAAKSRGETFYMMDYGPLVEPVVALGPALETPDTGYDATPPPAFAPVAPLPPPTGDADGSGRPPPPLGSPRLYFPRPLRLPDFSQVTVALRSMRRLYDGVSTVLSHSTRYLKSEQGLSGPGLVSGTVKGALNVPTTLVKTVETNTVMPPQEDRRPSFLRAATLLLAPHRSGTLVEGKVSYEEVKAPVPYHDAVAEVSSLNIVNHPYLSLHLVAACAGIGVTVPLAGFFLASVAASWLFSRRVTRYRYCPEMLLNGLQTLQSVKDEQYDARASDAFARTGGYNIPPVDFLEYTKSCCVLGKLERRFEERSISLNLLPQVFTHIVRCVHSAQAARTELISWESAWEVIHSPPPLSRHNVRGRSRPPYSLRWIQAALKLSIAEIQNRLPFGKKQIQVL